MIMITMNDKNSDIVTLLQDDALHNSCPSQRLLSHYAAEEIERLRVAGDNLARTFRKLGSLDAAYYTCLKNWEEI